MKLAAADICEQRADYTDAISSLVLPPVITVIICATYNVWCFIFLYML